MERQQRLGKPRVNYSYGAYNKIKGSKQAIRITEGCPNNCAFCYEPTEIKIFGIPKIERNHVLIYDMNLLCKPEALDIIKRLGSERVNKKVVYYELVCGIDYRFLTLELAEALKKNRFFNIRLAWDFGYKDQLKIKDAVYMLKKAGFETRLISIFIICNWYIPYKENLKKLDLMKVWRVKVNDCYYDNQSPPNIIPIGWSSEQIKDFRKKCRLHNQIVKLAADPNIIRGLFNGKI